MNYLISRTNKKVKAVVNLPYSKSIVNRLLIIHALENKTEELKSFIHSDDSRQLFNALKEKKETLDAGNAGTAMRFLTGFLAISDNSFILTGSARMHERPIAPLVESLRSLGADIDYIAREGVPPLTIKGKKIKGGKVEIEGSISSQFISAILLIAPYFEKGVELAITGKISSGPYIRMTIELMKYYGARINTSENKINVKPGNYRFSRAVPVEADWSAASYWYSIAALSEECDIRLTGLKPGSLQGDSAIAMIYEAFGVHSVFLDSNTVQLTKKEILPADCLNIDCTCFPDLAQTIAVTAAGLRQKLVLTGLHTLKIKETDRIQALASELRKTGADISYDDNCIKLKRFKTATPPLINTFDDHRMAMAFAPLALLYPVKIENPEVVSKSYPQFWDHLKNAVFAIKSV